MSRNNEDTKEEEEEDEHDQHNPYALLHYIISDRFPVAAAALEDTDFDDGACEHSTAWHSSPSSFSSSSSDSSHPFVSVAYCMLRLLLFAIGNFMDFFFLFRMMWMRRRM